MLSELLREKGVLLMGLSFLCLGLLRGLPVFGGTSHSLKVADK